MLRILLIAITLFSACLCSDARAQTQTTLDNCSLATTSTTTYQRWRTTTNTGANRVAQSIRVFNLDCLRQIINTGFPFPAIPTLASLIQGISNRICQVILNQITAIDPSELSTNPLAPRLPAVVNRRQHQGDRQLGLYA